MKKLYCVKFLKLFPLFSIMGLSAQIVWGSNRIFSPVRPKSYLITPANTLSGATMGAVGNTSSLRFKNVVAVQDRITKAFKVSVSINVLLAPPNISYAGPQTYAVGTAITSLSSMQSRFPSLNTFRISHAKTYRSHI